MQLQTDTLIGIQAAKIPKGYKTMTEQTKRVKSKIVYPNLGIVDEIEEEIFVRDEENCKKEKTFDKNESKIKVCIDI
jgi:phage gp16-like protein